MTMRLAINGIGVVGPFGCGVDALRQALAGERPAPAPVPAGKGETIPALLADDTPLERFIPRRSLRRIDHFSRLALLGSCLALEDAGLLGGDLQRLGVVVGTGWGAMGTTFAFLDSFIDGGDICSSPTHFSSSVHNAAAANISIQLKATGPSLTVSQFGMSVPSALLSARRWLAEGRADAVLVGGTDEFGEVAAYCWRRFFGVPAGEIRPLDFEAQSAVPGEGAAFLVLTAGERGKYGSLDDIVVGKVAGGLPDLPPRLLVGADGHRACGRLYRQHLPAGSRIESIALLRGSLPVGFALDLAAAALCAEDGAPWGCLAFGPEGEFALARLSR